MFQDRKKSVLKHFYFNPEYQVSVSVWSTDMYCSPVLIKDGTLFESSAILTVGADGEGIVVTSSMSFGLP